jgi:hypothetical protein
MMCSQGAFQNAAVGCVLIILLACCGCNSSTRHAKPVDEDAAMQALIVCLDAWSSGTGMDVFAKQNPDFTVQDLDWSGSKKLTHYEIIGTPVKIDCNLIVEVNLHFATPHRQTETERVTYIVGTDPVLTVFRKMF